MIEVSVPSKYIANDNTSFLDMTFVKGGTFPMVNETASSDPDEAPVHFVTLYDF